VIPTATEISGKPELDSESAIVRGHSFHNAHVAELQSPPYQHPSEIYTAQNYPSHELQDAAYYHPQELHSSTPHRELDAPVQPYAPVPIHPQQFQPPPPPEPQELHPSSPAPTTRTMQQLSPEAIAALQEEERRIDAEMEEVRRMKELREQKFAIQQKLRGAKGDS
jgi:hypothetical protein